MNRRSFISKSCGVCLSASVLPLIFTSCTSLKHITGTLVKDGLILNTDDFKIRDGKSSAYKSFIIIRNEKLKYPICIYRFSNNDYSALWMKCTHQGAELQASGEYLQCAAHGSEFDNKGNVINGPSTNDLKSFPVTVNNKEIFINLTKQL